MRISVPFIRATLGMGLAASLFLGCEQFLAKPEGDQPKGGDKVTTAPEDVALQLSIKETEDCKAMRDQVLAAHSAGQAPGALETDFISHCIVEVNPAAGAVADAKITLPPDLVPDEATRCHWIVTQIEGGREELIVKFRYYCPDDCDSLAVRDSLRHVKLCRDPDPAIDCAELKRKLASMDPLSEEYARLRHFLHEHCKATTPVEPEPALYYCDSLRLKLSKLDPASEDYARLKKLYMERCEVPHDTVKLPVDTIKVPVSECDQIMMKLKSLPPDSPDYARLKAYYGEHCAVVKPIEPEPIEPKPVPDQPVSHCEAYRLKLAGVPVDSPDYLHLKELVAKECAAIQPAK